MKKNEKLNQYIKLFISTFWLSASTFGGGAVIIPLMKKRFVDDLKWIDNEEMMNYIAISQSSPGAVAVNASILLGYHIAGFAGAAVTMIGTILPPLIIIAIISFAYIAFRDNVVVNAVLKGMQAGIAAVIINLVLNMSADITKQKKVLPVVLMIVAFVAIFILDISFMYIIGGCAVLGLITALITIKKDKGHNIDDLS